MASGIKEMITDALEHTHKVGSGAIRDTLVAEGACVISHISIRTNSIQQALYITSIGMFWVELILVLGGLHYHYVLGTSADKVMGVVGSFSVFCLVIFAFIGFAHRGGLYRNYSGLGIEYDLKYWADTQYSIIMNEEGIYGIMKMRWSDVKTVTELNSTSIEIVKNTRPFLGIVKMPPLILEFSSDQDQKMFMGQARKYV